MMYRSVGFSSVSATIGRSEMGLYGVARLLFSFDFGMGMMLVLKASVYSCVR